MNLKGGQIKISNGAGATGTDQSAVDNAEVRAFVSPESLNPNKSSILRARSETRITDIRQTDISQYPQSQDNKSRIYTIKVRIIIPSD